MGGQWEVGWEVGRCLGWGPAPRQRSGGVLVSVLVLVLFWLLVPWFLVVVDFLVAVDFLVVEVVDSWGWVLWPPWDRPVHGAWTLQGLRRLPRGDGVRVWVVCVCDVLGWRLGVVPGLGPGFLIVSAACLVSWFLAVRSLGSWGVVLGPLWGWLGVRARRSLHPLGSCTSLESTCAAKRLPKMSVPPPARWGSGAAPLGVARAARRVARGGRGGSPRSRPQPSGRSPRQSRQ